MKATPQIRFWPWCANTCRRTQPIEVLSQPGKHSPVEIVVKSLGERTKLEKKQEAELALLKTLNEKLQEQHNQVVEENDRFIFANNDLKAKLAGVIKEIDQCKRTAEELIRAKEDLVCKARLIEELNVDNEKKDTLIAEYEEKFERLEERMQETEDSARDYSARALDLDSKLTTLRGEVESLRRENALLQLTSEREAYRMSQERTEYRKATDMLRRGLAQSTREKAELEMRLGKKERQRKFVASEAQTEGDTATSEDAMRKTVEATENTLAELRVRIEDREKVLRQKEFELASTAAQLSSSQCENAELRRKRAFAALEISKLNKRLARGAVCERTSAPSAQQEAAKIIEGIKAEIAALHKDYIRLMFCSDRKGIPEALNNFKDDTEKRNAVETGFCGLLERLTDFLDETAVAATVAKMRLPKQRRNEAALFTVPAEGTSESSVGDLSLQEEALQNAQKSKDLRPKGETK